MEEREIKEEWVPRTRLGLLVNQGKITHIDQALFSGLPLRESKIIDLLLPGLEDAVLGVNMNQRMTDSGRRSSFMVVAAVGNRDGYLGVGTGKDIHMATAITKAVEDAKLNLIKVPRGCGSWECSCNEPHSIPFRVEGVSGGLRILLKPAPRGVGIVAGSSFRKVLELAGIKDVWTQSFGQTRTVVNAAKAVHNALRNLWMFKL